MQMPDLSIVQRFNDYCDSNQAFLEASNQEHILFSTFVRREFLTFSCKNYPTSESINYIETIFTLADLGKIELNVPYLLIEDLIEFGSYEALCLLLPYLDLKSQLWASKMSSKKGVGLILLRSVNLLRRKIVRSEHSKLAGLSLLLLTKIFSANERSGVNLKGDRNVDNKNLNLVEEKFHFASLHNFFYIHPSKLRDKDNWTVLSQSLDSILLRIEETILNEGSNLNRPINVNNFFSAKHLFSEKSFELQMDDQRFRLSLLVQILVLLQDFNCFSNEAEKVGLKIDRSQEMWISGATKKTFYLISLHQNGKEYFRFLRSVFRNEKNWISWKNFSCPSYEKESSDFVRISSDSSLPQYDCELLPMGNEELNRLWKYCLSDTENRKLKPDIESYILHEDNDEDNLVDTNFIWRAGRLNWKFII